ncbi:MAG TPA: nuclear transport factor 2 family protein [bacterium]|nr:nuclear transport factor 2 family protein [bacterium]
MTPAPGGNPYLDLLVAHIAAWSRHDLDAIMEMMTSDCVYESSGGEDPWGRRYTGQTQVREAYTDLLELLPDIRFQNARHVAMGERGVSEWTMVATRPDGSKIEARGCDLFEFRAGKIHRRDSYRKRRIAR